jgi:bacterioferritin-associated ferredoxin
MIVCVCRRISDRDIARAARDGCMSFDDLQIDIGVGTCCGKCHDCARQTLALHAAALAAAHDSLAHCGDAPLGHDAMSASKVQPSPPAANSTAAA